jgi:hypothetical protein
LKVKKKTLIRKLLTDGFQRKNKCTVTLEDVLLGPFVENIKYIENKISELKSIMTNKIRENIKKCTRPIPAW